MIVVINYFLENFKCCDLMFFTETETLNYL